MYVWHTSAVKDKACILEDVNIRYVIDLPPLKLIRQKVVQAISKQARNTQRHDSCAMLRSPDHLHGRPGTGTALPATQQSRSQTSYFWRGRAKVQVRVRVQHQEVHAIRVSRCLANSLQSTDMLCAGAVFGENFEGKSKLALKMPEIEVSLVFKRGA